MKPFQSERPPEGSFAGGRRDAQREAEATPPASLP